MNQLIVRAVIIGVLINLILPFLVRPLATATQIKPSSGAASLSFFDQLIHMFVHHAQVPLTSSIIVAIIVGLSVYLAQKSKKMYK